MKSQGVEAALFRVGNHALAVFQGAGHGGLAVSLQHGHVYHVIHGSCLVAQLDFHSSRVVFLPGIALQIHEGYAVPAAHLMVSCGPEGVFRVVSDPGALHDGDVLKAVFLEVFYDTGQQFAVGGGSAGGRLGSHQIGL